MSDVQDLYSTLLIIDSVYDPVVSYPDPPFLPAIEACATRWPRIFGARKYRSVYSLVSLIGQPLHTLVYASR